MIAPPSFDTLKIAQDLKGAGFTEQQAEALTDAIKAAFTDTVATKADLQTLESALRADIQALRGEVQTLESALRADLQTLESALRADLQTLESALRADLQTLESTLKADIQAVDARMTAMESRLEARMAERFESLYKHLWLGAAGMVATIAALIRLLSG